MRPAAYHLRASHVSFPWLQLDEAARLQTDIRMEFEHWLRLGYAATWLETKETGEGSYLLEPWLKS